MEELGIFLNITAWLIALISLIISVVALRISRRVFELTSREFVPTLDVDIRETGEIRIINKDKDLFSIIQAAYIKVDIFGFENTELRETVRIPLVTKSYLKNDLDGEDTIIINSDTAYAYAYLRPLPEDEVEQVSQRVNNCNLENSSLQILPSHRSVIHYVEIIYKNKFEEQKSIFIKKTHYHGSGYHQSSITEADFVEALRKIEIPENLSGETLWKYLIKRFAFPY